MCAAWRPIEDLPVDWQSLRQRDLEHLAVIWREQARKLKAKEAIEEFNQRLSREWSIETGIIENLYTLDRGITTLLIERGIEASLIPHGASDKPAEEVVAILRDHQEVLEGLFDFVASRRELSTSYIKELHQTLTRHQYKTQAFNPSLGRLMDVELVRGEWKKLPNNPTRPNGTLHEYCPPEQVAGEMERLVEWHRRHQAEGVSPEVEAAWLHHRFTQIHPFQDGNGRVARALASLVFIRADWFPLVISRDIRKDYIDALEAADQGDLKPLVKLFAEVQKRSFTRALSLSDPLLRRRRPIEQVLDTAAEVLRQRREKQYKEYQKVFELAKELQGIAYQRFREYSRKIERTLHKVDKRFSVNVQASDSGNDFWFYRQIVIAARKLGYYADTRTYRSWLRLIISEERQAQIIISFHALGYDFVGIIAASAFVLFRDRAKRGRGKPKFEGYEGPYVVCREAFQFSFREVLEDVRDPFEKWLEEVVEVGLDQWRRQL